MNTQEDISTTRVAPVIQWAKFRDPIIEHEFQVSMDFAGSVWMRRHAVYCLMIGCISMLTNIKKLSQYSEPWELVDEIFNCIWIAASVEAIRVTNTIQDSRKLRQRGFYIFTIILICVEISSSFSGYQDLMLVEERCSELPGCKLSFTFSSLAHSGDISWRPFHLLAIFTRTLISAITAFGVCLSVAMVDFSYSMILVCCSGVMLLATFYVFTDGFSHSQALAMFALVMALSGYIFCLTVAYMYAYALRKSHCYRIAAEAELESERKIVSLKTSLAKQVLLLLFSFFCFLYPLDIHVSFPFNACTSL